MKKRNKRIWRPYPLRERLAKTNAEKYEPDVAMTQNNLGSYVFRFKCV